MITPGTVYSDLYHAQSCNHRLKLAQQEGPTYPTAAAAAGSITQAQVPEQVQVLPPKVPAKATIGVVEPVFAKAPTPLNEQDRAGSLKRVFDVASMTVSPTASVDMPVLCTFSS